MKPEELLNSLDHIGADLLADAEQNVLVRTHRPWIKNAVAAVLAVAVGVGGFLTLSKYISTNRTPSATDLPTPNYSVSESLSILDIGKSWENLPEKLNPISDNCPALYDPSITVLPIYRSYVTQDTVMGNHNLRMFYSKKELQSILEAAAKRMGIQLDGEPDEMLIDGSICSISKKIALGTLCVSGDGELDVYYFEKKDPNKPDDTTASETNENLIEWSDLDLKPHLTRISEQVRQELNLPQYDNILLSQSRDYMLCFPTCEDPTKQLLARSFQNYRLELSSETLEPYNVYWYQHPGSDEIAGTNQDWLELEGWYPLITLEEAKAQALEGHYLSYNLHNLTEADLNDVALVYPKEIEHGLMLPYYQFWITSDPDEYSSDEYICVPAVRPEYLADWSAQEPYDPNDPQADERARESNWASTEDSLKGDYFTTLYWANDKVFSNGLVRIWQENDKLLKKNLTTGETETLFTLFYDGDLPALNHVTQNRLYFRCFEDDAHLRMKIYSVDYQNKNRIDLAYANDIFSTEREFGIMEYDSSLAQYTLKLIDKNDQMIVTFKTWEGHPWCMIDYQFYYIYVPALQDVNLAEMDEAGRDALVQQLQYELCRVNPDCSITKLGSFDRQFSSWDAFCNSYNSFNTFDRQITYEDDSTNTHTILDLDTLAEIEVTPTQSDAGPDGQNPASDDETALAVQEELLKEGRFSTVADSERNYFSDGHSRIWQETLEDRYVIWKKDLTSGGTEVLFSFDRDNDINVHLVGVTPQRLYFNWIEKDEWFDPDAYSVDYHNENRHELANCVEVSCDDGLIKIQSFHTDVRAFSLQVINSNDETIVDVKNSWGCEAYDEGDERFLYVLFASNLQNLSENEDTDAAVDRVVYELRRVKVSDGSFQTLGSYEKHYDSWIQFNGTAFSLNREKEEIRCYDEQAEQILYFDLNTMQLKRQEPWPLN